MKNGIKRPLGATGVRRKKKMIPMGYTGSTPSPEEIEREKRIWHELYLERLPFLRKSHDEFEKELSDKS
jgi:hypothetical protein